jgi:hypothetical protein
MTPKIGFAMIFSRFSLDPVASGGGPYRELAASAAAIDWPPAIDKGFLHLIFSLNDICIEEELWLTLVKPVARWRRTPVICARPRPKKLRALTAARNRPTSNITARARWMT